MRKIIVGTLVNKGCSEEKSNDFIPDAILIFVKKCLEPEFEITSNHNNYIVGIAIKLFLRGVTKDKKDRQLDETLLAENFEEQDKLILRDDRINPLRKLLNQLGETCQKVLTLWSQKEPMAEIAKRLNYKSAGMARKKKHQCLRKLYQIVENNPGLKDDLRDML